MKVLLASTSSGSRGGGELCLLYLGRALAARGHTVTLWASQHSRMDELAARFRDHGEVIRSDYTNTYDRRARSLASFVDHSTARRIAAEWRALRPDVIHLNKQNLEDGLDLVAAARLSGLPALAMIHITQSAAYLRAALAPLRDRAARHRLRQFPGPLVTTPESRRRDLTDFLGDASRVHIVTNGVPIPSPLTEAERAAIRAQLGITQGQLLALAVGRMVPQKRPLLFLETAAAIHRQLPASRFCWVGDGELAPEWDRWVSDRDLGHVIQRLPWRNDVPRLLGSGDLFIHVAEFEGLSFAVLEALAAGLPCAITPNLLREIPFISSESAIAIEGDWIARLRSAEELAAIGHAARNVAEKHFSFDRMAAEYETLYLACREARS